MEETTSENNLEDQEIVLGITDSDIIGFESVCRLCANHSDKVIGIYNEEGTANDLANKMNLYLPIKVSESDELPLQCCWGCASTVLAWHELVVASIEADRRLRGMQIVSEKGLEGFEDDEVKKEEKDGSAETTAANLTAFDQTVKPKKSPRSAKKRKKQNHAEVTLQSVCIDSEVLCDNDLPYDKKSEEKREVVGNEHEDFADTETLTLDNAFLKVDDLNDSFSEIKTELPYTSVARKRSDTHDEDLKDEDDSLDDDKDFSEWFSNGELEKNEMFNFCCQYCSTVCAQEEDIINHIKAEHPGHENILRTPPANSPEPATRHPKKTDRRKSTKIDQAAVNAAKVVVDGRVYYNCKLCGKSLHSPYTYIWHVRIHTGERPFVCDLCGKQFRVSQGLVRHLRETHEGIKNFPCDLCGRMFATRRNVVEHRRIHTNERPYICDLCGKTFKQKASLFVHNRSHTDSFPFRCSYCNQGFRTKPPLMIHITRHTGEKPYPCDVCGRCFRIKYELKRHRLIHSDEKPFSCVDCGLSFRQKRYLRNHNKINHNRATP